jgi:energy-coupling factor transport system permease protein
MNAHSRANPSSGQAADGLHPGAWWAWSLALGAAATRTTNPLILLLLIAAAGFVVNSRRSPEGSRTFWFFVRLGVVIIAARVVFDVLFGGQHTGYVVLDLPSVPLPNWAAGLHLGGAVTTQELLTAGYGGLQLAALVICVGSANALASPRGLLRALPGSLYEVGVAITVALSFAPQLAHAAVRVRRARRLRGLRSTGLRAWWSVAVPVLEDALDRSIELAAAMDARGFGRVGHISRAQRRLVAAGVLAGLLAIVVSVYEILDVGSPVLAGIPLLMAGTALSMIAVLLGGRHRSRTTYRAASWRGTEWVVLGAGLAAFAGMLIGGRLQPGSLHTTVYPLAIPQLPWPTLVGIALALVPAVVMSTPRMHAPNFRTVRAEQPVVVRR